MNMNAWGGKGECRHAWGSGGWVHSRSARGCTCVVCGGVYLQWHAHSGQWQGLGRLPEVGQGLPHCVALHLCVEVVAACGHDGLNAQARPRGATERLHHYSMECYLFSFPSPLFSSFSPFSQLFSPPLSFAHSFVTPNTQIALWLVGGCPIAGKR